MGRKNLQIVFASSKNSRGVPLFYVIRKYMPSPKDSENRDAQIFDQENHDGNMFTRDSSKDIDSLKELTLGADA